MRQRQRSVTEHMGAISGVSSEQRAPLWPHGDALLHCGWLHLLINSNPDRLAECVFVCLCVRASRPETPPFDFRSMKNIQVKFTPARPDSSSILQTDFTQLIDLVC